MKVGITVSRLFVAAIALASRWQCAMGAGCSAVKVIQVTGDSDRKQSGRVGPVNFTDALGNGVTVDNPQRVVLAWAVRGYPGA